MNIFTKPLQQEFKPIKRWNSILRVKGYKQKTRKPLELTVASKFKAKKKKSKLPKKLSIKKLEKKLRSILYPIIKKEEPNICVSCGKRNMIGRDHQVGHFIKAELCSLRWRYDRRILHPQCSHCNLWKRGNYVEYRKWMIKKYNRMLVESIEARYKDPLPMNFNAREFLLELINKYETKKNY